MNGPEKRMWIAMRKAMKGRWNYERIESMVSAGIPDIVYQRTAGTGWIELKASEVISRAGRVQPLPHFTIEQRRFLRNWDHTFLFWRIENHWFLFEKSFDLIGHVEFSALRDIAKWHWEGKPNYDVLLRVLDAA